MKRFLAILTLLVLTLCMVASCSKEVKTNDDAGDKPASDLQYVVDKGELVVGITEFAPMDYKDENGDWIGFDADMATKFAESLGVDISFQIIDWNYKIVELENKGIDCVWNGMTLTDEVKNGMATSNAYCKNAQVVVVKSDVADKYQTEESIKDLAFVVEAGSAGKKVLDGLEIDCIEAKDQAAALMEVSAGTSEACVIDLLMAGAMIGEGTDYENLTYTVALNSEEYGVGFRKGSDLVEKLNEFFKSSYADGSMMECANTYGVHESIIAQ